MIFRLNIRSSVFQVLFVLVSLPAHEGYGQEGAENSLFWEIHGKNLKKPSYLFGTFHLMGSRYVDSLTILMEKFSGSEYVVGELLVDSTMANRMMAASQLHDTSLDKLLDSAQYSQTASWLFELSGYDLDMFNSMNPVTVQILLMTMIQQKNFPIDQTRELPMDMYFQERAKKESKHILGLETFDIQVNALFGQFTVQRQAEMLANFVEDREKSEVDLVTMNRFYREGSLTKLEELLATQIYTAAEAEIMLDNRNKKWMEQLPDILLNGQTFIAVGALHLSGENGLVALLRNAGYTLTPILMR